MGEYVKYKKECVKIGTCEDLYYVSYQKYVSMLPFLKQEEHNLPPERYSEDNSGFRFRFPFPDEDNAEFVSHTDYNRGYIFGVTKELALEVEHHEMSVKAGCENSYNINITIPCPASGKLNLNHSPINNIPMLVKQQKLIEGKLWTVLECGYCEAKFRIDLQDAEKFCAFIESEEIKKRIMAGYD